MKFKTTNKEINNHYEIVLKLGYCELQSLLYFKSPFAYTSGINGWNADFYKIIHNDKEIIISTGYNPIGKNVKYDLINEYKQKARQADNIEQKEKLLYEFIEKAIV